MRVIAKGRCKVAHSKRIDKKTGEIKGYTIYTIHPRTKKKVSMEWKVPNNISNKEISRQLMNIEEEFIRSVKEECYTPDDIIFENFVYETYFPTIKNMISPSTYELYQKLAKKFLMKRFGKMKLKDIKTVDIQNFIVSLTNETITDRNKNKVTDKCLSPSTVKRYLTVLKSILAMAVKLDYIETTPARAEKLYMPRVTAPKVDFYTRQEAIEMLKCLEKEDVQFRTMIQIAIVAGLRRGEIVALKFSDVDFEAKNVTVSRSAVKIKGEKAIIKPPKDYEVRTVSLTDGVLKLIRDLKFEKEITKVRLGNKWEGDDFMFTQWNGEMMNPMTPTDQFSKFLARNDLKHIKFHALRHTCATLLLRCGVDIKQVQARLGHGDIETTNKYLHYVDEGDIEATLLLDRFLDTKEPTDLNPGSDPDPTPGEDTQKEPETKKSEFNKPRFWFSDEKVV